MTAESTSLHDCSYYAAAESCSLLVFSILQHHGQLLQTHQILSKHSTACFHSIYAFCCVRTSSLYSNNNNNKKILLQNCQWKSIASCKFWQALQRDINTVTPLSAFIWDIVYEMFNGLSQVYFMFWIAPKVKKRALEFYSLCLMQYHAAVAWAVIKRRATTRMHTLWFMEPMDPTAEITGTNISFKGWDGPKINHRKWQLCQNCLFLCTTGTTHFLKALVHSKIKIDKCIIHLHIILNIYDFILKTAYKTETF